MFLYTPPNKYNRTCKTAATIHHTFFFSMINCHISMYISYPTSDSKVNREQFATYPLPSLSPISSNFAFFLPSRFFSLLSPDAFLLLCLFIHPLLFCLWSISPVCFFKCLNVSIYLSIYSLRFRLCVSIYIFCIFCNRFNGWMATPLWCDTHVYIPP